MNDKLRLVELYNDTDIKILTFATYRNNDANGFIEKSVIFTIDKNNSLLDFAVTSDKYGVIKWENGSGIIECDVWSDSKSDKISFADDTKKMICDDVLDSFQEPELCNYFKKAVNQKTFSEALDIEFS